LLIVAYSKLQQAVSAENISDDASLQAEVTWFTKVAWNVALLCGDPCQEMYQLFLACYKVRLAENYRYKYIVHASIVEMCSARILGKFYWYYVFDELANEWSY